jgi:hypothetical protein
MRRQQYLMISIGVLAALVLGFGIPDARGSEPWPGRITGPDGEIFPKQKHPEYFTSAAWTGLALGALSGLLALAPSRLWRGLLLSGAVGSLSGVAVGIAN